MQYRLTAEALHVLDLLHIGKGRYEGLVNSVVDAPRIDIRHKGDCFTFGNPEWFEEAEMFKPGEWNDCKTVRPPKEGDYLTRYFDSDNKPHYALTSWTVDGGFYFVAYRPKKADFREIPQ